jgi:hypothetical protein
MQIYTNIAPTRGLSGAVVLTRSCAPVPAPATASILQEL